MKNLGLIGKKVGMTRVFDDNGKATTVTVVHIGENQIIQRKTEENDGYNAVQLGYGEQKKARIKNPQIGHIQKHNASPNKIIREFRVELDSDSNNENTNSDDVEKQGSVSENDKQENKNEEKKAGKSPNKVGVNIFEEGQTVDVIGKTKGKGFQGVYKRYGFGGLPASHGSMMHRRTGAVGAGSTPGRIWKQQKMPGRHGNYRRTIHNLKIVQIREDDQALLISGSLPGTKNSYVLVRPAVRVRKGKYY